MLPTPTTTTLNMTQNNALNRTKMNSNKKRREKNTNNNNGSNNKILYSYFILKMCPDQGRQQPAMPRSMQLFAPFSQVVHFISKYNETKPNKTRNKTQKVKNQA